MVGLLSNLPISDRKATDILKRENLLPILISITSSSIATSAPTTCWLVESAAGVLIRFTNPSDKKLQLLSAEQGVIPLLLKLLSSESPVAKCRAATSLAQLSQNTLSLRKSRNSRKSMWSCVPPSMHIVKFMMATAMLTAHFVWSRQALFPHWSKYWKVKIGKQMKLFSVPLQLSYKMKFRRMEAIALPKR